MPKSSDEADLREIERVIATGYDAQSTVNIYNRLNQVRHHLPTQHESQASPTITMSTGAPWKKLLLEHIQTLGCQTYTLATVANHTVPKARTVIFRGYYGSLPPNKHNDAPKNPSGYTSDLITFSTDIRMEKTRDIGGEGLPGGPAEACFWIPSEDNPSKGHQWRIRGRALVLPKGTKASDEAGTWILDRLQKEGNVEGEFDIEKEETAHFGNLSPNLRGSFKQPYPNTPREKGKKEGEDLKQTVEGLEDDLARKHFRVGLIEPERVEWVDLTKPSKVVWVKVGSEAETNEGLAEYGNKTGEWREVDMWP